MKTPTHHDVIVVGAGPVGLFLACELALGGCRVQVLEQAASPDHPLKAMPFGLRGLSAPTLEALHRRGLLEGLQASQAVAGSAGTAHWSRQGQRQGLRPGGHFAGIQFTLDDVETAAWPWRLPSVAGTGMAVTMQALESVLIERAEALGVDIRRGIRVEQLDASEVGVTVQTRDSIAQASWLVGCDGGRSLVRKAGGFDFSGTDPEFTGYSLQVEGLGDGTLTPGRHYTPTGMYTFQATAYRRGRVLLAGDAAHIHSPLGGQGLNLGLGDAINLGWKLAATIRGEAPAGLLDSYQAERHPVGASVLDWSRAQVALMRPTPATRALAAIMRDLIATRDGATYMAERVWGLSQRYDPGDGHPLVGRSTPDFTLLDGRCVGEMMRAGSGLLLDFESRPRLRNLAERWEGRIAYVAGAAKNALGLGAVLVRPDGIVAWACGKGSEDQAVEEAASRWFG